MEPLSNLFRDLPASLAAERVDVLVDAPGAKLERIVSLGHATPPGEWYEQETNEWVILLRGRAALRFEDESVRAHRLAGPALALSRPLVVGYRVT